MQLKMSLNNKKSITTHRTKEDEVCKATKLTGVDKTKNNSGASPPPFFFLQIRAKKTMNQTKINLKILVPGKHLQAPCICLPL
jgi:hypothetical protein